jgi:hypothetical protein
MPKDKWFVIDQKTKDLWDQIDDKYKSIILGYTKPSTSSPFSSKPTSKPSFPNKTRRNINLHEMSAYEFLQVHLMSWSQILNHMRPLLRTYQLKRQTLSPQTLFWLMKLRSRPSPLPPSDIHRVLSKNSKRSANLAHI